MSDPDRWLDAVRKVGPFDPSKGSQAYLEAICRAAGAKVGTIWKQMPGYGHQAGKDALKCDTRAERARDAASPLGARSDREPGSDDE